MTNKIEKDIIKNLDTSKNYVVALSGGVDSAVLATVVAKQTPNLRSVFVRHNQKHSNKLEEMANRIADNLKINHKALDSNLKENSSETKMRDARYEILYDDLDDDEILLTGHTLSDKVETFFINLLRGTRVRGLKSIPKMTPRLKRPLLGISKDNLINYINENVIFNLANTRKELGYPDPRPFNYWLKFFFQGKYNDKINEGNSKNSGKLTLAFVSLL